MLSSVFLVDREKSSLNLTLLEAQLTLLTRLFDFSRRGQDIIRLLILPDSGGKRIEMTQSKLIKTSRILDKNRTNFSLVGQICRKKSNGQIMEGNI